MAGNGESEKATHFYKNLPQPQFNPFTFSHRKLRDLFQFVSISFFFLYGPYLRTHKFYIRSNHNIDFNSAKRNVIEKINKNVKKENANQSNFSYHPLLHNLDTNQKVEFNILFNSTHTEAKIMKIQWENCFSRDFICIVTLFFPQLLCISFSSSPPAVAGYFLSIVVVA